MSYILCAIDPSAARLSVIAHAKWASECLNLPIHLVHAIEDHHPADTNDLSGSLSLGARSTLLNDLTQQDESRSRNARLTAEKLILQSLNELQQSPAHTLRFGQWPEVMEPLLPSAHLTLVGFHQNDHDSASLERQLEPILRISTKPVLVCRGTHVAIDSLLIAYDHSPSAQACIEFLIQSKLLLDAECHLIEVDGKKDAAPFNHVAERLLQAGYRVKSERLTGNPKTILLQEIQNRQAKLLMMGSFGHSALHEWLLGSTTLALLGKSPVSTLLIHSKA